MSDSSLSIRTSPPSQVEIEQCIWSGGRGFGFDDRDPGDGCSPGKPIESNLYEIVLSQQPVEGTGCRISTQVFTVGVALEREQYAPPRQ